MNQNLTDITVILDRSGSMYSCRDDAQGGLNAFINEQKEAEGEAVFTLAQFDDKYEVVHDGVSIQDVPECTLNPRGGTALYDAIGRTITTIGQRLDKLTEQERPGKVVVVIITDGMENASYEYSGHNVKTMIDHQQDKYSWEFVYIGANQDAIKVGASIGVKAQSSVTYDVCNTKDVFATTSAKVSGLRSGATSSVSYSNNERQSFVK